MPIGNQTAGHMLKFRIWSNLAEILWEIYPNFYITKWKGLLFWKKKHIPGHVPNPFVNPYPNASITSLIINLCFSPCCLEPTNPSSHQSQSVISHEGSTVVKGLRAISYLMTTFQINIIYGGSKGYMYIRFLTSFGWRNARLRYPVR